MQRERGRMSVGPPNQHQNQPVLRHVPWTKCVSVRFFKNQKKVPHSAVDGPDTPASPCVSLCHTSGFMGAG
jgi:hypothetical protein